MSDNHNDDLRRKYLERHRRRHGERPFAQRAARHVQRFFRKTFNIREGRAPYHVIRKRFVNGARLTGTHLCILIVAMVIACIGLDLDSDIAIVGAMLICPIMGSVLAISYGAATLDRALVREAVGGLLLQMVFCLVTSTLYFRLSPIAGLTPALIDNSTPTAWDLLLALVGGFAGGLGNSRDQEPATLISGVAVATALMPPLCSVGYGLAFANFPMALSALYEFGINVAFIVLSAEVVLLLLRVPLKRDLNEDGVVTEEEDRMVQTMSRRIRRCLLLGTVVFAIPCIALTAKATQEASDGVVEESARYGADETARELAVVCPGFKGYTVGIRVPAEGEVASEEAERRIVARVETTAALSGEDRSRAQDLIRLDVPDLSEVEFIVVP